jgi:hypothetical protein
MTDEWKRIIKITAVLVGVGGLVGILLGNLVKLLQGFPVLLQGPAARLPAGGFAGAGLCFGYFAGRLAERMAGFCGEVLLLPISVGALTAVAVGIKLGGVLAPDMDQRTPVLVAIAGVMFWMAGAWRTIVERLR